MLRASLGRVIRLFSIEIPSTADDSLEAVLTFKPELEKEVEQLRLYSYYLYYILTKALKGI